MVNDKGGILDNSSAFYWETSLVSFPLQKNYTKILAREEFVIAMNAMRY
jgi:hypothetical protein